MNILLINNRVVPYNISNDELSLKIIAMQGNRHMYNNQVSGYIYGNTGSSESTVSLGTFSTNEFGTANFRYPTSSIANRTINTARLWASGYFGSIEINSSVVRANFILRDLLSSGVLDAGSCPTPPANRTDFNVYDGGTCGALPANRTTFTIYSHGTCP